LSGVFINYRGEDSAHCAALIDHTLSFRLGIDRVFRDCRSISAGEDFADAILSNLIHCSVLLVVIGPRWLTLADNGKRRQIDSPDDWIHREIAEAFAHGLRVVPILTDDVEIPAEADLPTDIARLSRCQYLRIRHRHDRHDLARLVETLLDIDPGLARGRAGTRLAARILTVGCLVAGLFTGSLSGVPDKAPSPEIGEDLPQ
jgi:TIR domain